MGRALRPGEDVDWNKSHKGAAKRRTVKVKHRAPPQDDPEYHLQDEERAGSSRTASKKI
ncbi:MAG TPA: hypothetical protein VJ750_05620 [Rhizomicrobium sp.]|nr:hypothetical protein [Rhizomicrobium sp.]